MTQSEAITQAESILDQFVFMDKTFNILDIGLKTEKNVVLFGPGGHGKSEVALEFMRARGLNPYIITMGKGMTADRLFGGIDIEKVDKGKIEYLVENSFMNHEFVILEEMMDGADYLLEQMKDILSSGYFRNGTQIFKIKTKFIVACTNKNREEFAKDASLKALMERFPLELNVIWDNYTEASYNTLLSKRFGAENIDPMIPFLLEEYHKGGITISPRIAIDTFEVYNDCGPDALIFIADFAKKPTLISEALKKFEATIKFKQMGVDIDDLCKTLNENDNKTLDKKKAFVDYYKQLRSKIDQVKALTVNDDLAQAHAQLVKAANDAIQTYTGRYNNCVRAIDEQEMLTDEKIDKLSDI